MHISNKELTMLKKIDMALYKVDKQLSRELFKTILSLELKRSENREKTRVRVAEKRKYDKMYARSKVKWDKD